MARTHLGIRVPEGITGSVEEWTTPQGMEFTVHFPVARQDGDQEVIVGASHEDVGLVNWYRFDTYAEFFDSEFLGEIEDEEES